MYVKNEMYVKYSLILVPVFLLIRTLNATPLIDAEGGFSVNTDLLAASASVGASGDSENRNANTLNSHSIKDTSSSSSSSNASSNHICTREETYAEEVKIPSMQPVRIRSSNWCLEIPPRCSNYKTEMRQVMQLQNVTKTRTIRFCCDGYSGNISINDTVCKPVCRGGCGRGFCLKPDVCSCDAGYTGKHCTQRCDHDHWGGECKNICRCQNGAACDNKSGLCHCTAGWTSELCDLPCPAGSYGVMCRKECGCYTGANNTGTNQCHAQTGECIPNGSAAAPELLPLVPPNLADLHPASNVTHVMIETLNSTIVNITHNLDRIAKNIAHAAATPTTSDPVSYLLPDLFAPGVTTPPAVIVIKPNGETHHTPKIIVHQPASVAGVQPKTPEVIHVITNWQQQQHHEQHEQQHQQQHLLNGTDEVHAVNLAGLGVANSAAPTGGVVEHDSHLLTTLLIVLLVIMTAIAIGFLYVYRRYHWQRARVEAALAERNMVLGSGAGIIGGIRPTQPEALVTVIGNSSPGALVQGKTYLKPLPDLPAFTQMVCSQVDAPAYHYDPPSSNNSSVKAASYSYARKESIYSVIAPKSRKCSSESHLYDEIPYPLAHQQLQQHHEEQQQQQVRQQQQQQLHVPHLQVPIQNINYLQVPSQHSRKLNHL